MLYLYFLDSVLYEYSSFSSSRNSFYTLESGRTVHKNQLISVLFWGPKTWLKLGLNTTPGKVSKKYTAIYPKLKVLVYVRGFWNMFWNRPRPKNYPMEVKCQKLFYSIYEFSNSEFSILNFQIRNVQFRSFKFLIFSCDQQLKEWPCHSVSSFERLFVSLFWFVSFIAVRRITCQATFLKRIIDSSEAWLSILLAC